MEKEGKRTDFDRYDEVSQCKMQLSLPLCSVKMRASSAEATILGNQSDDAKSESKAVSRKKKKHKSKNAHLKAVTKKSHLEINTLGKSPSTQKTSKEKKQDTRSQVLRNKCTAGKAVIDDQNSDGIVDRVSLRSKASLKAWPSRSHISKKDCNEVIVRPIKLNCQQVSKLISSHRCFDFASGSTVQDCCLSSERGFWVSADPLHQSHKKQKRVDPRIVKKEGTQEASPNTVSTLSASNETSGNSELPGFHYDPDKKRYFKIVSSSNNCMSNVVTRERIAFDKNEKLRQEELKNLAATGRLKDPRYQTTVRTSAHVLTLLDRRKQGIMTQEVSTYQLHRFCIAKLRPHAAKGNRFLDSPGVIIQKMKIHAKENQLLIYYSENSQTFMSLTKINSFEVVANGHESEVDRSFAVYFKHCLSMFLSNQVSDLCFAAGDSSALYCANNHSLNTSSINLCAVKSPSYSSCWNNQVSVQSELYLTSCASTSDCIAVGTEHNVLLYNYAGLNLITHLCTSNTAIHALAFANTSSKVLFCAAKNGRILMYDERSSRQKPAAYLSESGGFSFDLYMTKDDRYLLSAKANGQRIEKWDLRQGRVVVDYPGHISECTRTPLAVDQREEFLSAVGSDSYTRIWDLKTGELMKVLPPPLPATRENVPSVCFVDLYGESRNHYPGLLLGMSDELHFYSL